MEIKILDYLDESEIKEIVVSELREQIKTHFKDEQNSKRLLSNLAYHFVQEEINKIVPNYETELINKIAEMIKGKSLGFNMFDFDSYGNGLNKSLGAKIVEQTILENRELIKNKIINEIQNRDYSEDAWLKFEFLAEQFISNIYDFVELIKTKK